MMDFDKKIEDLVSGLVLAIKTIEVCKKHIEVLEIEIEIENKKIEIADARIKNLETLRDLIDRGIITKQSALIHFPEI